MRTAIVIPNLNGAEFLGQAIRSALDNDVADFIVVADNASTDDSLSVVEEFYRDGRGLAYGRLGVVVETRRGTGRAKNAGVKAAVDRGADTVMILDSDNWLEPDTIACCLDGWSPEGAVVVAPGVVFENYGSEWEPPSPTLMPDVPITTERLLVSNRLFCSSLFPTSLWEELGGFDVTSRFIYDDWDFWIRAAAAGYGFGVVNRPLLHVRLHPGQATAQAGMEGHWRMTEYLRAKHAPLVAMFKPFTVREPALSEGRPA